MADVTVWANDLKVGRLPHVCVVTGEPTEGTMQFRFATTPPWILLLILVGALFYIVAYVITVKRASGRLAVAPRVRSGVLLKRYGGWTALCVTVVAFFVGLVAAGGDSTSTLAGFIIIGSLLGFVASIIWIIIGRNTGLRGRVRGVPYIPDKWVELTGVHPFFAAAVQAQYSQGQPAGWPAVPTNPSLPAWAQPGYQPYQTPPQP